VGLALDMGLGGHMSWPPHVLSRHVKMQHTGPLHGHMSRHRGGHGSLVHVHWTCGHPLDMAKIHAAIPRGPPPPWPWRPWPKKFKHPQCVAQTPYRTTPELPTWIGHVPRGHGFLWSGSCLVTFSFQNPISPSFDSLPTMPYFLVF
jgi:hypothetical protein